jgi:probable F420-dependent oxidoreductase
VSPEATNGLRLSLIVPSVGPGGVLDADSLSELAQTAENAGFDACSVTDHPVPMEHVERHTGLDPFAALTHVAAATERLLLHTGILVLPYRNPFIVAQSAATVDYLSDGRLILGLGAGYLRQEFAALGVDIGRRGELMDEGVAALRAAWTNESLTLSSPRWVVEGNWPSPQVVGDGPPIWLGGNGRAARARAAALADGWSPFETPPDSRVVGQSIGDVAQLGPLVADFRRLEAEHGRASPSAVCYFRTTPTWLEQPEAAVREDLDALEALGVDWLAVRVAGRDGAELGDEVRRLAAVAGR